MYNNKYSEIIKGDNMPFEDIGHLNAEQRYDAMASFIPKILKAGKGHDGIKHLRSIMKGRGNASEAVIGGISIIESVTGSPVEIKTLVICPDEVYTPRAQSCAYEAAKKAGDVLSVSPSTFELIGAKKNSNGLAALIRLSYKEIKDIEPQGINIVLDSLELPGNVGAVIRTADGAGLKSVIITNPKVRLNNPALLAASRGAFANMDIVVDSVSNISAWANEYGVKIFLADTKAESIHTQAALSGRVCFVVGCERYGIDEKWYEKEHELLKIPMLGNCDSLNAGVAGSILIYEALRQQM